MIKLGEKGVHVIELQNTLNNKVVWGNTPKLIPDGQFGNATLNAIKMFQSQNKLPVTGIADATTLAKLGIKSTQLFSSPSVFSNLTPIHYLAGGIFALGVLAFISYKIRN
jgi:peptidoglycan hydrolase-like protein with peptidoglycan-binding domain